MINKLKEFIYLGRFNSPTGALLLAYPCFWGIALSNPILLDLFLYTLIFLIGAFCMRAAGCTWNDILDKDIDKKVHRTKNRPIASGKISITEGIIFIFINCLIGLLIIVFLPYEAQIISLISIPLVIIYPLVKRITFFPQLWLGITFNIGLLISYSCMMKEFPNINILIIYFGSIFWTIGYDTMYALQDYDDDLKNNIKSSAVKLKRYSGIFASFCHFLFTLLFCIGVIMSGYGYICLICIVACGIFQAYNAFNVKLSDVIAAKNNFFYSSISALFIWISLLIESIMK